MITPRGHLDTSTHLAFEERIDPFLTASTKVLILDMTDVTYVSSAGLRVIFKAWKAITGYNGTFLVTNLQPQIKKVFDIVKALPGEQIFASMEEVDAYLDLIQRKEMEKQKRSS